MVARPAPAHSLYSSRMRIRLVALAAACLALSACSGSGSSGGDGDSRASSDAKAACATLDRMGTYDMQKEASSSEFGAAVGLATAAAALDAKYEPLKKALTQASSAAARTFKSDNPTTKESIKKAKDLCAKI
ncbi:hypothetical protein GCM10022220_31670 [Actinocatenispora rupis]